MKDKNPEDWRVPASWSDMDATERSKKAIEDGRKQLSGTDPLVFLWMVGGFFICAFVILIQSAPK